MSSPSGKKPKGAKRSKSRTPGTDKKLVLKPKFGLKPNTVKTVVVDFAENTTSHGIPRIPKTKKMTAKLFWAFICLVCLALFIWQAMVIINRYLRYEKITQIELQFKNAPFPAVTLCNLNPYKKSLAKRVDGLWQLISAFEHRQLASTVSSLPIPLAQGENKIRRKRAPKKYNYRYTPVYTHCYCPYKKLPRECLPFPSTAPTNNDSLCLCFYDRIRKSPWPCYPAKYWSIKKCDIQCDLTGSCSPANASLYKTSELGNAVNNNNVDVMDAEDNSKDEAVLSRLIPCVCQNISNYCIATPETDFLKLWEPTTTVEPPSTTTAQQTTTTPFKMYQNDAKSISTVSIQVSDSQVYVTGALPEHVVDEISYTLDEFVLQCTFNQRDCNMSQDFQKYTDPKYGNCYVFNYESTQDRSSQRAGPMYEMFYGTVGLSIVLFVNGTDYLPYTTGKGVRINIHPQTEYPFPDTFGYNAPPGFLTSFGIRLKQVERISWPFDDCIENGTNEDYIFRPYQYSTEGCYRSCLQKTLVKNCTCSDPMFPRYQNNSHCRVEDTAARSCINDTKNMLGGMHGNFTDICSCKQPCKQIVYDITFSAARWPHAAAIGNYRDICANTLEDCESYLKKHAVYLEIYYEQLNYELLRESQAYMLANLLADLGGQLGLWMGISVITCFEFFVLFWDLLRLCCNSIQKKRGDWKRRLGKHFDKRGDKFDNTTVDLTVKVRRNALTLNDKSYKDISDQEESEDDEEGDDDSERDEKGRK